jgi:NTP pyrophosphatase (non-canonical NTP hydrolase)
MIVIVDSNDFLSKLKSHAQRKAKLYDGIDNNMPVDTALRYLIEEVGEIATEISRERLSTAVNETLDVAHCAMLVCFALQEEMKRRDELGEFYI